MSTGVLTLSAATAQLVSQMDGRRSRVDIQADFMRRVGRMLFSDELASLIDQLDEARFLVSPAFEAHVEDLTERYRASEFRPIRGEDSLGAPAGRLAGYLDDLLAVDPGTTSSGDGRVVGLVAPHLDYARGGPCYAAAYRDLAARTDATRFVILGTNHFGLSRSVVGTRKDFQTPFGIVPCDVELVDRLGRRCGADLCGGELDHAREHSIELQVVLLKHVLGDRPFTIAPFLCPDPCGPSGTRPADGRGVDLRVFAEALREEVSADRSIFVIAGADLSHVGRYFQDARALDSEGLAEVERSDRATLRHVVASDSESLVAHVATRSNPTNICSVGCLFTLGTSLVGKTPRLLRYHQAVTKEAENCVTCAAIEYGDA